MSNEKEKRENYAHTVRERILNNDSIDYNVKDVLMEMFEDLDQGLIRLAEVREQVKDIQKALKDPDAHKMT